MTSKILLLAFGIAGLTGCATSYKTGQTPDDVYFSPAPKYVEKEELVREEENTRDDNYYDYRDRALRLKSQNYRRWSSLDNPYYFDGYSYSPSNSYRYNYTYGYSYSYNPYVHFGYTNNYCSCACINGPSYGYYGYNYKPRPSYVYVPGRPAYVAPRGGGNIGYGNPNYSNTNNSYGTKSTSGTNGGGVLNRVFNNSNSGSSNNNSGSSPTRTYEPSSSSSSGSNSGSSSSGSNSGGGTVRPARNGN